MTANRLLLKFALRSPRLIVMTTLFGFSGAVFNGISTALVVPVILAYLGQSGMSINQMPPILQKLVSLTGAQGEQQLLVLMGLVLLTIMLKNAATYGNSLVAARLTQTLSSDIRKEGLRLLLDVDLAFYHNHKIGDLMHQLGGEVARTADSIKTAIQIFITIITMTVFLLILLSLSWQLTLIATGLSLIVSVLSQLFVRRAKQSGEMLSSTSSQYSIALLEMLSGIRLVKAAGQERNQYHHIAATIDRREKAERQSQANYAIVSPVNEVAGMATVLIIVISGKVLFSAQMAALSTLLLIYLLTLFRMLPLVGQLNGLRSQFANSSPSVQVVYDFLQRDRKPIMVAGTQQYQTLQQGIRFEQLSFRYPSSDDWTLRNLNLELPKGQILALVGSSGAGKSTLADLLPRFYDCNEGRILIDGQDIRSFDPASLRSRMGIVSQETFLFNATILDNIAYGCDNVSHDAVVRAAQRANAYEFIQKLPEGFDTHVGDRGVMLSGGQRQRLAIARALLRDPDILILDEATSALDTVSERLVQQAIDELSRDRTVLVIAHRLSTIQTADQIAVFDQGRVVEVGNHQSLLAQGGLYSQLYAMQFSSPPAAEVLVES
jgi:ATP-binding cassette, subfamily B, bacterial MsbA